MIKVPLKLFYLFVGFFFKLPLINYLMREMEMLTKKCFSNPGKKIDNYNISNRVTVIG